MSMKQFIVSSLMEILGYKKHGEYYLKKAHDLILELREYIRKNILDETIVYKLNCLLSEYRRIEEKLKNPNLELEAYNVSPLYKKPNDIGFLYNEQLNLYKSIIKLYKNAKELHDELITKELHKDFKIDI